MYEAIVTSTWVAAHTERLRVGSLVLATRSATRRCWRARPVSIDHASGGSLRSRHRLGFGARGVRDLRRRFHANRVHRVERFRETLEVLARTVGRRDRRLRRRVPSLRPRPPGAASRSGGIPIVIGGIGTEDARARTRLRRLVERAHRSEHADRRATREGRRRTRGRFEQMVVLIPAAAIATRSPRVAERRFGSRAGDRYRSRARRALRAAADQGIERVDTWFCDFAPPRHARRVRRRR